MGESLEVIKKFVEAANVCERLVASEEGQPFPLQSRVWANAASLACKHVFVFVKAEERHL
jgi:hypothetical protein